MRTFDGHAHLGSKEEQNIRELHSIDTFMCGTNPETAKDVEMACNLNSCMVPTYGLHPWYADQYKVEDMIPFMEKGHLMGEIGMDSEWCDVPLEHQKKIFIEQLELAKSWNMPVILHTKGQEAQILKCIAPYEIPILVHWYSTNKHLDGYIRKDCYFTVGPDVYQNVDVQNIVNKVSIDRLLVETDGFSAVQWALEEKVTVEQLPNVLTRSMWYIAKAKHMDLFTVAEKMEENFKRLRDYYKKHN